MRHLFASMLGCLLILLTYVSVSTVNADEISIEDLLIPDDQLITENLGGDMPTMQAPMDEVTVEDLLGPSDIFPFLPDNHRDSGTGKFNSF